MSDISTLRTEKIPDFEALLNSAPYDFLRIDARFGRRIMLLGLPYVYLLLPYFRGDPNSY